MSSARSTAPTTATSPGWPSRPDSRWLAWSHPGPQPLAQIRLAEVADPAAAPIDVTPLRFADTEPSFSSDGKYLAFLSTRSFDPIYDAYVFDLSFPNGCRPQLVTLSATTPSPFDPDVAGRRAGAIQGCPRCRARRRRTSAVDADGIDQRVVPFPVPAARYASLRAVAGGFAWLRAPITGSLGDDLARLDDDPPRPALERFDLTSRRTETLLDAVDRFVPTGDGNRLVVVDKHEMRVDPGRSQGVAGGGGEVRRRRHRRPRTPAGRVTPGEEWRQMYDEAGRLMRDHYFRADMNGVDWDAALARYRPLVERLGSTDDFVDLLWEAQGELGTSHAYVRPRPPENARTQGMLGADIVPRRRRACGASSGSCPASRPTPGPLTADGARCRRRRPAMPSSRSTAIRSMPAGDRPSTLADTAGKPVALTIEPADGERTVVVVTPLADETPLRYQAWVTDRRAFTRERSDGRLGYLHVPDMMSPGWAQLHRDLRVEMARDGIILDLRDNGGGHTSQLVVEKFARRIVGWVAQPRLRAGVLPARRRRVVRWSPSSTSRPAPTATSPRRRSRPSASAQWSARAPGVGSSASTGDTRWSTARWSPSRATPSGWRATSGASRTTASTPTSRCVRTPADIAAGRDPQLERAIDDRPRRARRHARQDRPRPRPCELTDRPTWPWISVRKAASTGANRSMPPSATSGSDTIAVCTPASAYAR